jgi:hypothetical protein
VRTPAKPGFRREPPLRISMSHLDLSRASLELSRASTPAASSPRDALGRVSTLPTAPTFSEGLAGLLSACEIACAKRAFSTSSDDAFLASRSTSRTSSNSNLSVSKLQSLLEPPDSDLPAGLKALLSACEVVCAKGAFSTSSDDELEAFLASRSTSRHAAPRLSVPKLQSLLERSADQDVPEEAGALDSPEDVGSRFERA